MADIDLERAKEAWRVASSADVVRALQEIDEFAADVAGVIRAEAERRELTADSAEAVAHSTYELLGPIADALRKALKPSAEWLWTLHGPIGQHPFFSAVLLGILCAIYNRTSNVALTQLLPDGVAMAILMAPYFLGIAYICLPLRKSLEAVLVAIIAGVAALATGAIAEMASGRPLPGSHSPLHLLADLLEALAFFSGIPAMLLFAIVHFRNRYWPYHEPGKCRVCEYDLRGLPEPRCPECGTPFEAEELSEARDT